MTPENFVSLIRKSIIEENLVIYKELFSSTDMNNASDPHWVRALGLYAKLNDDDKGVLFDIVRQVMVDTVSNLFAVLDGVSQLEGQEGEFSLLADPSAERLNSELQDRFLELEEKCAK